MATSCLLPRIPPPRPSTSRPSMQEFGQYDDWRIAKNMDIITAAVKRIRPRKKTGQLPLDAYTLYYVGQALYQVGGKHWRDAYPSLRDAVTESQKNGMWRDIGRVRGRPGELYGTSVACFILAIPNRYLPILQEGKIESIRKAAGKR